MQRTLWHQYRRGVDVCCEERIDLEYKDLLLLLHKQQAFEQKAMSKYSLSYSLAARSPDPQAMALVLTAAFCSADRLPEVWVKPPILDSLVALVLWF